MPKIGWVILCALFLTILMQTLAATPVQANPYPEQLGSGERISAWDELESWIAGMLILFIDSVQTLSPLVILAVVFVGAGVLLLGALLGNSVLKSSGVSAILAATGAYLVIKNAPAIVLMIRDL